VIGAADILDRTASNGSVGLVVSRLNAGGQRKSRARGPKQGRESV